MSVKFNPDKKFVQQMMLAIKKNNGYCPCKIEKNSDNICICKEFRNQINDKNFKGFCHCKLYYKD